MTAIPGYQDSRHDGYLGQKETNKINIIMIKSKDKIRQDTHTNITQEENIRSGDP